MKALSILSKFENYESGLTKISFRCYCPYCGGISKSHGYYTRYYKDRRIKIKRFYCKECKRTWSLQPAFCLPYRRLDAQEVYRVIKKLITREGYPRDKKQGTKGLTRAIRSVMGDLPAPILQARRRAIIRVIRALSVEVGTSGKFLWWRAENFSRALFNTDSFAIYLLFQAKRISNTNWSIYPSLSMPSRDYGVERAKIFADDEPTYRLGKALDAVFAWLAENFDFSLKQGGHDDTQILPRNAERKPNTRKDCHSNAIRAIQELHKSCERV